MAEGDASNGSVATIFFAKEEAARYIAVGSNLGDDKETALCRENTLGFLTTSLAAKLQFRLHHTPALVSVHAKAW